LIRRDGKNLVLSASGRIFVNLIDGFEVLAKYKGFWEGHSIDGIPADMLKDLRVLKNTELVHPAYEVINKAIETISTAEERILITVDKPVKMAIPTLHEVVDKGVEAYLVGTTVPPEFSELGMHALMEHENVKIRITPDIYMGVSVLDNREAGMILPDLQGSLDWNYAIYGKDPEFITWVERAFWNMYKKGEVLKIEK
jgi:predicted transcriptional regulator